MSDKIELDRTDFEDALSKVWQEGAKAGIRRACEVLQAVIDAERESLNNLEVIGLVQFLHDEISTNQPDHPGITVERIAKSSKDKPS